MKDLERLLLERELHLVLVRYARLCDERDWDAIAEVFSEDASANYGGWSLPDRTAILAMLRNNLGGCGATQHLLGNLVVALDGESVSSRIAVRAAHRGAGELKSESYDCMGYYHDQWTRTCDGWRIAQRAMVLTLEFGSRKLLRPAA